MHPVVVVVPCLNEAGSIGGVVTAVLAVVSQVVVVDDGSTDGTGAAAAAAGATVLKHPENRGKGAALQTGLRWAAAAGFAFAITLDGDGQHDPADLPAFVAAVERTKADLIIGNRMADTRSMPWLRRWVNRWMSRRISRCAGHELPDTQCGYRLIRLGAWRGLQLTTTGFEVESEMLLAFLSTGRRVEFIPIRTIYKTGQSKIHPVRDTLRWFRWWRRARRLHRRD